MARPTRKFISYGKMVDISGNRFGRLIAIKRTEKRAGSCYIWECQCDCGKSKEVSVNHLNKGAVKSCGCLWDEVRKKNGTTHDGSQTREYSSWRSMRARCNNPTDPSYKRYGGRGITVCERWNNQNGFENFLSDMGSRPQGTTLDRIDNDGSYEPKNCKWSTLSEQTRNRANSKLTETLAKEVYQLGKSKTFSYAEIGRRYEISYSLVGDIVNQRIWKGANGIEKNIVWGDEC